MDQYFKKNGLVANHSVLMSVSLVMALAVAGCSDQSTNPADAVLQAETQDAVRMATMVTSAEAATPQTRNSRLAEGEIRTLPCEWTSGGGWQVLVVRGEIVGGTGSDPIIGQRIIETRGCRPPTETESIPVRPSLASVLAMPRDRARVACNEYGQIVQVWRNREPTVHPNVPCRSE